MTLQDLYNYIDQAFPDGVAGSINPGKLRTQLKNVVGKMREDVTTVTAWSPVLALVNSGSKTYLQVTDWVNGQGVKPAVGSYLGAGGFTSDMAQAISVRGEQGIQGLANASGLVASTTSPADGSPRYIPILELPASAANTLDYADIVVTAKPWDNTASRPLHLRLYVANRGGFVYEYDLWGAGLPAFSVEAWRQGDGRTIVYTKTTGTYLTLGTCVVSQVQATVYASAVPQATVAGTKVFDTAAPATYPPRQSVDQSGNVSWWNRPVLRSGVPGVAVGDGLAGGSAGLSADANDLRGRLTLSSSNSGNPGGNRVVATVTFTQPLPAAPTVVLSPANVSSAGMPVYVSERTTTGFKVSSGSAGLTGPNTWVLDYAVIC